MGGDTLRRVGDVWTISDTTEEVESTYGFDKFSGSQIASTFYTFNKIKEKGGDLIAYLDAKTEFETTGIGTTWDETVKFTQTGEFKCKTEFNITKGFLLSNKIDGFLVLKGKNLSDDSSWNSTISIALRQKGKLK